MIITLAKYLAKYESASASWAKQTDTSVTACQHHRHEQRLAFT